MHYQVLVSVRFQQSIVAEDTENETEVIGYYVVLGINANDFAEAVKLACQEAIDCYDTDVNVERDVEHLEITAITIEAWKPEIQKIIKNRDIHSPGIYYRSGLAFVNVRQSAQARIDRLA